MSDKRDDSWVEGYLDEIRENDDLFFGAQERFYDEFTHPIVWYALIHTIKPPIVGRSVPEQVTQLFGDLRNMFGLEQYRYVAITTRTILEYLLADCLGKLEVRNKVSKLDERNDPDLVLSRMISDYCQRIKNKKQHRLSTEENKKLKTIKDAMHDIRELGNDAVHATIGTKDAILFNRFDARKTMESLLVVVEGLYNDRGF